MARFGEQRLVRRNSSVGERLIFRLMGVADPAHYLHSLYLRRELDRVSDFAPLHILDAGCGPGDYCFYLARRYPRSEVLGIDINDLSIEQNRENARRLGLPNVHFELVDLSQADFAAQFDLVISIDVLEHIVRQREALGALFTALKPGGLVFFHLPTVRERPVPFSGRLTGFHAWAAKEHIAEERTAEEFISTVRAVGLEVIRAYRTFGYFTGELATSLFALPFDPTTFNRVLLALLALPCRVLALADTLNMERTRYAVAVLAWKPTGGIPVASVAQSIDRLSKEHRLEPRASDGSLHAFGT